MKPHSNDILVAGSSRSVYYHTTIKLFEDVSSLPVLVVMETVHFSFSTSHKIT